MTGVAVLKMRHGTHQFVSTVLPFITEIGKENVHLTTIRITSTLYQAYKHLKVSYMFDVCKYFHQQSQQIFLLLGVSKKAVRKNLEFS